VLKKVQFINLKSSVYQFDDNENVNQNVSSELVYSVAALFTCIAHVQHYKSV